MYYRGASAALIVYDIHNRESFDGAKAWVAEVKQKGDPTILLALVGNKSDMPSSARKVPTEEAAEYAKSSGLLFIETSAKTNKNVVEAFTLVGELFSSEGPQFGD